MVGEGSTIIGIPGLTHSTMEEEWYTTSNLKMMTMKNLILVLLMIINSCNRDDSFACCVNLNIGMNFYVLNK